MAGEFPNGTEFKKFKLDSVDQNLESRTQSGVRQSRKIGGHLWRATIDFNLMSKTEFALVWSFLMRQDGGHESFTIRLPGHDVAEGAISGSPTYTSTTSDKEIVTGGWSLSVVDNVKAMDVFTIAGDSKVYMATDDLDSDGSGNGNLLFKPALRKTPGASAALTFNNVTLTCALESGIGYDREGPFFQLDRITVLESL